MMGIAVCSNLKPLADPRVIDARRPNIAITI